MYPLLPWKLLTSLLMAVIAIAVFADDLGRWIGVEFPDSFLVRVLPVVLLGLFAGFFGPTSYWSPWRILWRVFPKLNVWFPDLNGVWIGVTISNWPAIKKLIETAQSDGKFSEDELLEIPGQRDAMAVQITNSLFKLRIQAYLSSTDAVSHSITAKPWREQHTDRIHLSYIYEQETPNPIARDEECHLGAADLILASEEYYEATGNFWTTRNWRTGRNTAGKIELNRVSIRIDKAKSLRQYALEQADEV